MEDGVVINLNIVYMDVIDEIDFIVGVNVLWYWFELGYIYVYNKIEVFNVINIDVVCEDDCWIIDFGNYDIYIIYVLYLFFNVMDMKNFNIYFGVYVLWVEVNLNNGDNSEDVCYGGCLRFKYFFWLLVY